MLPKISGLELCKQIRTQSPVPILFLSAKGTTQDRIDGLKLGANDYLPKPFDLEELILKVNILTKASFVINELSLINIGDHQINCSSYEVKRGDRLIHTFTKREIALIRLFKEKEGQVCSTF
jgi:two-component system alkaline phosphatase synthesis response regulator PhoP